MGEGLGRGWEYPEFMRTVVSRLCRVDVACGLTIESFEKQPTRRARPVPRPCQRTANLFDCYDDADDRAVALRDLLLRRDHRTAEQHTAPVTP